MKKIILFLTIAYVSITAIAQKPSVNYTRLINAIGTVESRMTDNAVNGSHAGFLQISKVCVEDCNRINKIKKVSKRYTLQDRFNRQKSIEMFWIVQNFYNPTLDIDYMILMWNEGNSAMKKPKRKTSYYKKVMAIYKFDARKPINLLPLCNND